MAFLLLSRRQITTTLFSTVVAIAATTPSRTTTAAAFLTTSTSLLSDQFHQPRQPFLLRTGNRHLKPQTAITMSTSTSPAVIPGRPTWQQTMLRIRDPAKSLKFYQGIFTFSVLLALLRVPLLVLFLY